MTTLQFQAFPDRILNVLSSMQDEVEFNFEYDEDFIYNDDEDDAAYLDSDEELLYNDLDTDSDDEEKEKSIAQYRQ